MDACFELAKSNGHDVMWLGVWEYNPRAQRFYEKNGFRVVGKHTFVLGSDPQTDLLMQKELATEVTEFRERISKNLRALDASVVNSCLSILNALLLQVCDKL